MIMIIVIRIFAESIGSKVSYEPRKIKLIVIELVAMPTGNKS